MSNNDNTFSRVKKYKDEYFPMIITGARVIIGAVVATALLSCYMNNLEEIYYLDDNWEPNPDWFPNPLNLLDLMGKSPESTGG